MKTAQNVSVKSVVDAMTKVRESVTPNLPAPNEKPRSISLGQANKLGCHAHQGDVTIRMVGKNGQMVEGFKTWKPLAENVIKDFNGQVAEGETRGSRHIIANTKSVVAYRNTVNRDEISRGPVIQVNENVDLDHPDHGTIHLDAGCVYEFTFQSTADTENARTRSRD